MRVELMMRMRRSAPSACLFWKKRKMSDVSLACTCFIRCAWTSGSPLTRSVPSAAWTLKLSLPPTAKNGRTTTCRQCVACRSQNLNTVNNSSSLNTCSSPKLNAIICFYEASLRPSVGPTDFPQPVALPPVFERVTRVVVLSSRPASHAAAHALPPPSRVCVKLAASRISMVCDVERQCLYPKMLLLRPAGGG